MASEKKPPCIAAIFLSVRIDPGRCAGHILDLFAPGDSRLQTIIDHRHTDAFRSVEAPDVAINIVTADTQTLVAGRKAPSMNKNHDRPAGAVRNKKIEPMLSIR